MTHLRQKPRNLSIVSQSIKLFVFYFKDYDRVYGGYDVQKNIKPQKNY
jgi:hypothetical protein